jgi:PAS domain S-box-containing protein
MSISFNSLVPYSEEWWRTTLASIGDAVIVTDANGNVAFMNPIAESLTGWTDGQAKSRSLKEIFPIFNERNGAPVESPVTGVLETGAVVELANHTRLKSKNGLEIPIDDSAAPIKDQQGNISGVVLVFRDVSERKRAEERQLRLSAIIDSSDDAIVGKTLESVITSWNPAAERIFGYPAKEAVGQKVYLIIPPELHKEEEVVIEKLKRGERIDHYETMRRRKDGTLLNVSLTISPIKDSEGHIIGASKIARNITEQKNAERERAYLAAIIDSSDDAIVSKTLESVITSWNPAAERIFGYSAAEAIGQQIYIIIPPERHAEEEVILSKLRRGERIDHFETIRQRKDGALINVSVTISPIKNSAGEIIGASKIARDITEKKQIEKERDELLKREQAARAMAEEANRFKDEFLATVSHELRTPLNSMFGWIRLLREGQVDETRTNRALEVVERNARAQERLIEDILDTSRIMTGKLRIDPHPIDLPMIVDSAVDSIRPTAEARNISLQVLVDPGAGPVLGDANRLQQIIWNLLTNSMKFTPKGGRVRVQLVRVDSHVEISVQDSGQGISPEFLPHVFDRFRQAEGGTTRQHGGLGLGLAIVRHLVELHGGTVQAESEGVNKGAIFTIRLPLAAIREIPSHLRSRPGLQSEAPTEIDWNLASVASLTGIRVLVVDDEADARELLITILEKCGAEVQAAGSAVEGFEIVNEWRPHVIVSDIGMPQEDGYMFIRRVRALAPEKGGGTPAAALTAYTKIEDRLRALSAGFQTHVGKPVDPTELAAVIGSLAGRTGRE